MTLAFSTRGWGTDAKPAQIIAHARALDVCDVHLSAPSKHAARVRRDLQAGGVRVISVAARGRADAAGFPDALAQAGACAAQLRARAVIVEGGAAGDEREAAADRLVRMLHGPAAAGVPLALRNGSGAQDLLGFEELDWVLSELPALGFWFDPLAAHLRHGLGAGPATQDWIDAYAGRVTGVFVHGGEGGSHPTEGGPAWGSLVQTLPRDVPWVLDLEADLDVRDAVDAVRWLRALRG